MGKKLVKRSTRNRQVPWYTLIVTEEQTRVLATALEVFARLGIGQFRGALEYLPLKTRVQRERGWHKTLDLIGGGLSFFMKKNVDGWFSSLGIACKETSEDAKIAWDLHQVVRRCLSWNRAVKEGVIPSIDAPRKWPEMMTVNYDDPLHVSQQPLAKIRQEETK